MMESNGISILCFVCFKKQLFFHNRPMNPNPFCKCGKKAIAFIVNVGWICEECLDEKIKETEENESGFFSDSTDN